MLVIGLAVLLLTSSLQQTLLTLGNIGIALLWTFGLMGWLDWPQDGIHEVVAPLLLVVGVCDAMHYLSRLAAREHHVRRRDGLVVAAREVGPACLVTTLTTGAAFLSFTASDLSTFDRFGVITAFGTLACLLLTFTALPLAATLLPDRAPRSSAGSLRFNAMIRRLMDAVCDRRNAVLSRGERAVKIVHAGSDRRNQAHARDHNPFGIVHGKSILARMYAVCCPAVECDGSCADGSTCAQPIVRSAVHSGCGQPRRWPRTCR